MESLRTEAMDGIPQTSGALSAMGTLFQRLRAFRLGQTKPGALRQSAKLPCHGRNTDRRRALSGSAVFSFSNPAAER
jgi:hypothetical protein